MRGSIETIKRLQLKAVCQCTDCEGDGYIRDPEWDESYEFSRQWEQENPKPTEDDPHGSFYCAWLDRQEAAESDWWANRGHPGGHRCWPPEESKCSTCQGTGREVLEITLKELASLLALEAHP